MYMGCTLVVHCVYTFTLCMCTVQYTIELHQDCNLWMHFGYKNVFVSEVTSQSLSANVTGHRIAELELHIALAHMMKNFKVEYQEDTPMDYIEEVFQVVPDREINFFQGCQQVAVIVVHFCVGSS